MKLIKKILSSTILFTITVFIIAGLALGFVLGAGFIEFIRG